MGLREPPAFPVHRALFFFSGEFGGSCALFLTLARGGLWCFPVGGLGSPGVSVFTGTVVPAVLVTGEGSGHRSVAGVVFSVSETAEFPGGGLGFSSAVLVSVFSAVSSLPPVVAAFNFSPAVVAAVVPGFIDPLSSVGSLLLRRALVFSS